MYILVLYKVCLLFIFDSACNVHYSIFIVEHELYKMCWSQSGTVLSLHLLFQARPDIQVMMFCEPYGCFVSFCFVLLEPQACDFNIIKILTDFGDMELWRFEQ